MVEERLQKILAQAGIASRRKAESFITDGRVRVNGKIVRELGSRADLQSDQIEVEGYGQLEIEPLVYIALHKPEKVICTLLDPERRQTVLDLILQSRARGKGRAFEGGNMPRVYPVGRLDFDAEGLVLLTNDGALANRLIHPSGHVPKTYMVKVKGRPDERDLERLRCGVRLPNPGGGFTRRTKPADVVVAKHSAANTWIEITLFEGRHHQIKRMCQVIGRRVIRLIRTEFGGIQVDPLPPGAWRFLAKAEVESLRILADEKEPRRAATASTKARRAAKQTGQNPKKTAPKSRKTGRGSTQKAHKSNKTGRKSKPTGRKSKRAVPGS